MKSIPTMDLMTALMSLVISLLVHPVNILAAGHANHKFSAAVAAATLETEPGLEPAAMALDTPEFALVFSDGNPNELDFLDYNPLPGLYAYASIIDGRMEIGTLESDGTPKMRVQYDMNTAPRGLRLLDDGSILVGATSNYDRRSNRDHYFMRVRADGTLIWARDLVYQGRDLRNYVTHSQDESIIISGWHADSGIIDDLVFARINKDGTMPWLRRLDLNDDDQITGAARSLSGGALFTGVRIDAGIDETLIFVGEVSAAGDLAWIQQYAFPTGLKEDQCRIAATNDGGFILAGGTISSRNAWLMKVDAAHMPEWTKTFDRPLLPNEGIVYSKTEFTLAVDAASNMYISNIYAARVNDTVATVLKLNKDGEFVKGYSYFDGVCDNILTHSDQITISGFAKNIPGGFGDRDAFIARLGTSMQNCLGTAVTLELRTAPNATSVPWPQNEVSFTAVENAALLVDLPPRIELSPLPHKHLCCQLEADIEINPSSACAGTPINMRVNNISEGTSFRWLIDGEAYSSSQDATITLSRPGEYNFELALTGDLCSKVISRTITVQAEPQINFETPAPVCKDSTRMLTVSGADSYQWTPADGLSCTDCPNPVFTADQTSTYVVQGTSAAGCTTNRTVTIEVYDCCRGLAVPQPDFDFTAQSQCIDAEVQFSLRAPLPAGMHLVWDFGPSAQPRSSTQENVKVRFLTQGTQTIKLTYIDSCGFRRSNTRNLNIVAPPLADAGRDILVCSGEIIEGQIGSPPIPNHAYRWTPATKVNNPNIANPTVKLREHTKLKVTVTDLTTGCRADDEVIVGLGEAPSSLSLAAAIPVEIGVQNSYENVCRQTKVRNNSRDRTVLIDSLWFTRGAQFSAPPGQLPIVVPPGQSAEIEMCFAAEYFGIYQDTIMLGSECGTLELPLQAFREIDILTDVNDPLVDLRTRALHSSGSALTTAVAWPNPVESFVNISLQLGAQQNSANLRSYLINQVGQRLKLRPVQNSGRTVTLPGGDVQQVELQYDLTELLSRHIISGGVYYLEISLDGMRGLYPIVVKP